MNTFDVQTPKDSCLAVAKRMKAQRKALGLNQEQLSIKAGISLGSLRRFEQTGEISFHSLVRIAKALDSAKDFDALFVQRKFKSIQEVIDAQNKQA